MIVFNLPKLPCRLSFFSSTGLNAHCWQDFVELKKLYSKRVSELESRLSQKTKRVEQLDTDKQVYQVYYRTCWCRGQQHRMHTEIYVYEIRLTSLTAVHIKLIVFFATDARKPTRNRSAANLQGCFYKRNKCWAGDCGE